MHIQLLLAKSTTRKNAESTTNIGRKDYRQALSSVDIIAIDIVLARHIILKVFVLDNNGAGRDHGVDG